MGKVRYSQGMQVLRKMGESFIRLRPTDVISQGEASRILGVSRQYVSNLVKSGRLQGCGFHNQVARKDVLAYKDQLDRKRVKRVGRFQE